jgi:membrane associated rhomboid family serine protease
MGLYDREYYREEQEPPPGLSLRAPRTVVTALIIINVAFWIGDFLTPERRDPQTRQLVGHWLSDGMAVHTPGQEQLPGDGEEMAVRGPAPGTWPETLTHVWMWWQLVAYGFAHSSAFAHIFGNMIGLWFLGRDIEYTYGRREFLRLYLALLFVGGLTWAVLNHIQPPPHPAQVYGASGAVAGIVVLYALNFPRRTVLLFFVLPMPAWVLGVLLVGMDLLGAAGSAGDSNVAYTVHLAGAAFALLYFKFRWNLTRLTDFRIGLPRLRPRPKLRVHDPEQEWSDLNQEVDRILEKISREGEDSLTRKERHTLEEASREFQRRRRDE